MLHWDYYMTLESDLLACRRYVEFHESNMHVHSIEFVRLLLATCSEVEVLAKALCGKLDPSTEHGNIEQYRKTLAEALSLSDFEVEELQTPTRFKPFLDWAEQNSLTWWRSYNFVKHDRANHYQDATLKNCIRSLGGLYILNLYQHRDAFERAELRPGSKLFAPQITQIPLTAPLRFGYRLPNVEKFGPRDHIF